MKRKPRHEAKGKPRFKVQPDFPRYAGLQRSFRPNIGRFWDGKLIITRDDATAISHLEREWQGAQERVRIHRNKPLPEAQNLK